MKKFFSSQKLFIIFAIILGFFLNQSNCTPDPFCDRFDPLHGDCFDSCKFGTATQWLTKSIGMWVLLNTGAFIGKENLKEEENLKDFLNQEDLKRITRSIDEKWKIEDKKNEEKFQGLLESIESKT